MQKLHIRVKIRGDKMKWEYRVLRIINTQIQTELDFMGEEEWELVNTFDRNQYTTLYLKGPNLTRRRFKRLSYVTKKFIYHEH